MTKRRSRGDGGLHWDESRQRWIASVTVGYTPAGKRIVKKASGKTKTAAKDKLKQIIRDYEDGLVVSGAGYTVADAVQNWLDYGLSGRDAATVEKCKILANKHVISGLGARKLVDLTADDVDRWLADKSKDLSTRTLRELRSILVRSISRAQARDKVKRNVVLLCEIPKGKEGRPSKSLTLAQAEAVLKASEGTALHTYVVLSLLLGARTEELRALTWSHVNLDGTPPSIMVWRSVREGGDTKTKKSRRTLAMPRRCVDALKLHRERQDVAKKAAGDRWQDNDLVFASKVGTELDAHNVRRSFRAIVKKAGLDPKDWTPREMRHSFVSLLSDSGMPIEAISRLVGHRNTSVTETVYRKQLRPVLLEGAEAMDNIFRPKSDTAHKDHGDSHTMPS
ncbi:MULTISPECIES: site-specific integrase [Nonomuraea]|uniref:Site-specific recombinase XerD n=1 Tax=Nonomuraea wenchangensis TaxID=568860 RepID=A0A1I0KPD8_9ACTN|nr:site-specific integrase [Nonomuraea wenchangensis]SEU27464.1 Site-specific recombinase XerD [Nonomuraea wenchangensis]